MEEAEASSSTHIDGSADAKNSQSQSNDPPKSSDAPGSTQVEESPTSDSIGSMKSFQSSSADANAEPDSKSELAMSPREAEIESEPVPKSEESPLTSSATPVEKQVAGVLMTESDKTGGEHSASEESVMYANVASVLASKVIEINKTARESSEDLQQSKKPSLKRKNDSLSLIMSYEGGSSSSSDEETEKENEGDQFREHRYQTISISSDSDEDVVEVVEPVQNGEKSSDDDDEDEETDHGSGNENNSNSESEAGRGTADGDCSEARSQPDKAKARRNKALTDPLMLDYLPPIEKLTISVPEEECVPVGKVYSIVDRLDTRRSPRQLGRRLAQLQEKPGPGDAARWRGFLRLTAASTAPKGPAANSGAASAVRIPRLGQPASARRHSQPDESRHSAAVFQPRNRSAAASSAVYRLPSAAHWRPDVGPFRTAAYASPAVVRVSELRPFPAPGSGAFPSAASA
ncbi:unnamed protein product [Nesidiocoris tenuis]|uniref:Uncharacterized protein n=1 Tax=Nesidiocoris tenuis TaxID=355587 RepID=A0A6H5GMM2_9HEMI|nr:unnamed protein product [Nesidiocoris tenuis]